MWSPNEAMSVSHILAKLDALKFSICDVKPTVCVFRPSDAKRLLRNFASRPGALAARRVLEHLGCDESLPFQWQIDNKLIQHLILKAYIPELLRPSMGLGRALRDAGKTPLSAYLAALFPGGFVIKPTRGSGSERSVVLGSSRSLSKSIEESIFTGQDEFGPENELFLVQEKVLTTREYRVHTMGRRVIPTLTFRTHSETDTAMSEGEREDVCVVVRSALKRMPDGLCSDLICGWDIGFTANNSVVLFEINYSGFHPVFRPGFQCSRMLSNSESGAMNSAHLLNFISEHYSVTYEFEFSKPIDEAGAEYAALLYRTSRWRELLEVCEKIRALHHDTYLDCQIEAMTLRKLIYTNKALAYDRIYVECLDWLRKMTVDPRCNLF